MSRSRHSGIWSDARRPRPNLNGPDKAEKSGQPAEAEEHRSVFQQDYDRLLFSTPVRRLADKTQVWPMDQNDGIRSRLTHSHEVANLARSIGTKVYLQARDHFVYPDGDPVDLHDVIQPILLVIGLGHDLGNPPFGHQGEVAIGKWFESQGNSIFSPSEKSDCELSAPIPKQYWSEFTKFDGNPQSLRLLTTLQAHIDDLGLDLSAATLAAGLKYPVSYQNRNRDKAALKKGGYFESERKIVDWIRAKTGLREGERHPLIWIMEACDDIAYSILDIDDALKKGIMSPDEMRIILHNEFPHDQTIDSIKKKFEDVDGKFSALKMNTDIKIQYLRAFLIKSLIDHASTVFTNHAKAIFNYRHEISLMEESRLCNKLKEIAKSNVFNHSSVLRTEACGAAAIDGLMTALWDAISDRKEHNNLRSDRNNPRARYIFAKISPNYLRQAADIPSDSSEVTGNIRYRELRLLTDMISGMTDSFALRFWEDIKSIPYVNRP